MCIYIYCIYCMCMYIYILYVYIYIVCVYICIHIVCIYILYVYIYCMYIYIVYIYMLCIYIYMLCIYICCVAIYTYIPRFSDQLSFGWFAVLVCWHCQVQCPQQRLGPPLPLGTICGIPPSSGIHREKVDQPWDFSNCAYVQTHMMIFVHSKNEL